MIKSLNLKILNAHKLNCFSNVKLRPDQHDFTKINNFTMLLNTFILNYHEAKALLLISLNFKIIRLIALPKFDTNFLKLNF